MLSYSRMLDWEDTRGYITNANANRDRQRRMRPMAINQHTDGEEARGGAI